MELSRERKNTARVEFQGDNDRVEELYSVDVPSNAEYKCRIPLSNPVSKYLRFATQDKIAFINPNQR